MAAARPPNPMVGGQAVIEGVMMRSPRSFVVAVRRPDGRIVVREEPWETLGKGIKPLRWPFLRGAIVLIESLWNGLSALEFSAQQAMPDEAPSATPSSESGTALPRTATTKERAMMAGTLALSLALGLGLFVGAPHLLTWAAGRLAGTSLDVSSFAFHAIDGLFKAAILIGYMALISRLPDIRRVFEYHGAEHKLIWAHESGLAPTPANGARFGTLHPRCGTSFLLIVLAISIVLFALVFPWVPRLAESELLNHLALIGLKLPLMLPVAGLAYELQRYSASGKAPRVMGALAAPGMWLQRITTKEPDEKQLEVAAVALARALKREALVAESDAAGSESAEPRVLAVYDDLAAALAA